MKHNKSKRSKSGARGRWAKSGDEKTNDPVKRDEFKKGDLGGMRQWLKSLSYESLVNALEFTFQADANIPTDNFSRRGRCGDSRSHEFDLLIEMSSYQSSDRHGMFSNCHEWHRSVKARLEAPYLFRWVDTTEVDEDREACNKPGLKWPENQTAALSYAKATSLPSDLLDMLALAGVKRSTSALLQTFNEADEIDEAFESLPDSRGNTTKNINSSSPSTTVFALKAYHGITGDGTILGRGSTIEQQNADRSMLLWTTLVRDKFVNTIEENSPDQATLPLPRCRLSHDEVSMANNDQQRKKLILDTLHVSSRGNFLSRSEKQNHLYMAPWFHPTQQWFSLPMYLASRFEASLWDSYLRSIEIASTYQSRKNSLVQSVTNLDVGAKRRVLCYAIGVSMREDMKQNSKSLEIQFASPDSIKNTLIWNLLLWNESGSMMPWAHNQSDKFAESPLLEWNTPLSSLKSIILEYLQDGLAREAERSLVQSISAESNTKPNMSKKKRKKRIRRNGSNANQRMTRSIEYDQKDDCEVSDDEVHVEMILPPTSPSGIAANFCDVNSGYNSPHSESNVVKVTVLTVIDDIIHNIFSRLGVQNDEFNDFVEAVNVKSRVKIPSVDGVEVATTALVSNNAGYIDDARVDTLQTNHLHSNYSQSPNQSRRRISEVSVRQNEALEMKRCTSLEDRSVADKKPPTYPVLWPSSDSILFPQASQGQTSIFDGAPLCMSGALDSWNSVACQKQNETSIFTELLKQGLSMSDRDQIKLVSSTAASVASSREDTEDAGLGIDDDCLASPFLESDTYRLDDDTSLDGANKGVYFAKVKIQSAKYDVSALSSEQIAGDKTAADEDRFDSPITNIISESHHDIELSPPLSAPETPSPQLSPILVSLADLGKLRDELMEKSEELKVPALSSTISSALPPSQSRGDLRSIDERRKPHHRERDDHQDMCHRQVDALLSYRNVVAQSLPRKSPSLTSQDGKQMHRDDAYPILIKTTRSVTKSLQNVPFTPGPEFPGLSKSRPPMPRVLHLDVACARSEGGLDGNDDASHCNVIPRAQTDDSKDGATTISSAHSSPETEKFAALKEQRNSFRDMCLTLGAENAKLRNLLASKTCAPLYHPTHAQETMASSFIYHNDQHWPVHNSFPHQFTTQTTVAMSDAGIHSHPELAAIPITYRGQRGEGVHGQSFSTASTDQMIDYSASGEDDVGLYPSVVAVGIGHRIPWQALGGSVQSFSRRTSGGGTTYAESDISLEHNIGHDSHVRASFGPSNGFHQDSFFSGIESRLSMDINRYMKSLKLQLAKTEDHRSKIVEAITKTVKALWPRATIKMYGSHVTKLCLPSSDMDFVISLPAVHKNAPAMAPGDLEGRNAIIETNQKVLARKLKGESWLDQQSIKVIERTAVPVIKVSTKDARSRVVQLDLSFDAKEHHGMEALNMIQQILEQMPVVRPLVLVLKQFLLDRGLLTTYTGGLSSYCLFLMVARYCQEQAPTWNDSGSLLMGLLDFYGNFFDPRITGISVRTRQYFFRSQDALLLLPFPKQHRFTPLHRQFSIQNTHSNMSQKQQFQSGKFDPIWVEDPLNPGNNVGRNAFRIFQVQRAFSDAHRALVASLEWDNSMHEFGNDGDMATSYPLLKCLLQNEDVFLSNDDPVHR
ncbi:hypothetical protein ACHAXA_009964 [Cyclostephanos tholiformis]|uniref:Poly(A) RNA polymerase mitochondrial-like central palm domain-containing protein n=1 Tax=Cyclostephanos tholiformis TaxID=382380 RepID=A0ABD3RBY6_9STRA